MTIVILNFFNNLINKEINIFFNIYDFFLSLLLFVLIYSISTEIRIALNLQNTSLSTALFLISFFIVENIFQLIFPNLSFKFNFFMVNILWVILLKLKKISLKKIMILILNVIVLRVFSFYFYEKLTVNINLRGDVKEYFFSNAKNIYEYSYAYSIKNSVIEGYPQFSTYLQNIFSKFLIFNSEYDYFLSSTLVLFFISMYVLHEAIASAKLKYFILLFYISLILNSDFLQFLFTSSLMSEGIVTVFTAIIFFNISKFSINNFETNTVSFFLAGILYYAKQFTSIIIILLFLYFTYKKQYKFSLLMLFGIILKELSYFIIFKNLIKNHHLSQIDLKDTLLDLILFRDLNLFNIVRIIENLLIDRPMAILITILLLSFFSLLIKNKLEFSEIFLILIIFINFIFIFILYISAWRYMELESPIRFIYTYLLIKLIVLGRFFELENKFKY